MALGAGKELERVWKRESKVVEKKVRKGFEWI